MVGAIILRVAVIFNGRPSSGKDYFANALFNKCDGRVFRRSIKKHIINRAIEEYNLSECEVRYFSGELIKEIPHQRLGGMSWREMLTHISEDKMKIELGENGIVLLECEQISKVTSGRVYIEDFFAFQGSLFIYSDCGYHSEALTVLDNIDKMFIVRLRNTKDEKEIPDRRELLDIYDNKVTTLDFDNPKEPLATTNILNQIIEELK